MRRLVRNVFVDGRPYGPAWPDHGLPPEGTGLDLPADVWADDDTPVAAAEAPVTDEPDDAPVDLDQLDKPALLAVAAARGVTVDGRWGVDRLRTTIREALQ